MTAVHALVRWSLIVLVMGWAAGAGAQVWPTKPVRLIVGTGAGAATDLVARFMSEHVSRTLGQQLVVENVPGPSGIIGAQTASRAAPDGYTFLFGQTSTLASNPVFYRTLNYDPRDFAAVAMVCDHAPFVLAVTPNQPFQTVFDLIAYAKAHPGKLSYGVDGTTGYPLVFAQLFVKRANIDIVEVRYRSVAQVMTEAVNGATQLVASSPAAVLEWAKEGKFKLLAISSEVRFLGLPDVPTVAETLPGFRVDGWFAVAAPKGVPAAVVGRMNGAIDLFLKDPGTQPRFLSLGLSTSGAGTPGGADKFIEAERLRWVNLAREVGIEPQ